MYKPISHLLHSFLFLVLIGSSGSIAYYLKAVPDETPAVRRISISEPTDSAIETAAATLASTHTPVPRASATFEAVPATDWSSLQPGLERRVIPIYDAQNQAVETVHIWRLDQKRFRMDVAFDASPRTLETWQQETNAAMVINGGYYSIENERYFADGLTVLNGQTSGRSFNGFGGMLAIDGRRAELRWLVERPYNASESLRAALQSFPILVKPGGELGFGPERENHVSARRTVIGQDHDGRILFIITPRGYFTLHQLSVYLTESDLDLDIAINLDGGGSTGILVAEPHEIIPPTRPLPFVILVYPR